MTFEQLQYVVVLAEEKNFSRAAKRLYISQPSLSQSIASLEKSLNTQLFFRTKSTVVLTDNGRIFVEAAHQILKLQNEMLQNISESDVDRNARINVAISYSRSAILLPIVLPAFTEKYPNTIVNVIEQRSADMEELLIKGIADLAISNAYISNPSIRHQALTGEQYFLFAFPPGHRSVNPSPGEPDRFGFRTVCREDLQTENFIRYDTSHRFNQICNDFFEKNDVEPTYRPATASNALNAMNLVSTGYGAALVPQMFAQLVITADRPIYYKLGEEYRDHPLMAFYHKDRPLSGAARRFCDLVKEVLDPVS